ncbi:hypothetical protein Tco_0240374 [Tanacetum coccineum]
MSKKKLSKSKKPSILRRSESLEDRGRSKIKSMEIRAKSRLRRSEPKEISPESSFEEDSEDTYEDLSMPYKRPKPTPFTSRINRARRMAHAGVV